MLKKRLFTTILCTPILLIISCLEPDTRSIEYRVTGTASRVDITMENAEGGTSQYSDVAVPWSTSFSSNKGNFVYISAQNQGQSGTVTVSIISNGTTFKTSTSSGAYVIATASGSLD